MAEQYKTEAIVLKKNKMLEKDVMVTLFTLENGKIRAIAKGIKSINSRRAPHVQTGNLINVTLQKHHDIVYLSQSSLISGFSQIKNDEKKVQMLYVFFFLIDRLLPEDQAEPASYNLTKQFLVSLSRSESFSTENLRQFLQKLLSHLGYLKDEKKLPQLILFIEEIIHEKIPYHLV